MADTTTLVAVSQSGLESYGLPESLRQESGSNVKGEQLPLHSMSS